MGPSELLVSPTCPNLCTILATRGPLQLALVGETSCFGVVRKPDRNKEFRMRDS